MKTEMIIGILSLMVLSNSANAAPKQIAIKSAKEKSDEKQYESLKSSVDLERVEDPEVRKALRVLLVKTDVKGNRPSPGVSVYDTSSPAPTAANVSQRA